MGRVGLVVLQHALLWSRIRVTCLLRPPASRCAPRLQASLPARARLSNGGSSPCLRMAAVPLRAFDSLRALRRSGGRPGRRNRHFQPNRETATEGKRRAQFDEDQPPQPHLRAFRQPFTNLEDSHIVRADRLGRLVPVLSLALYWAVSTDTRDAMEDKTPTKKDPPTHCKNVARSLTSWFKHGLRRLWYCLQRPIRPPPLWAGWNLVDGKEEIVMSDAVAIQREYYTRTADVYNQSHAEPEHVMALHLLAAFINMTGVKSVLDVGAGTGRAMRFLRMSCPSLTVKGVEPVAALREQGHRTGIPEEDLVEGDGANLPFAEGSFDLVCEFAILHHVSEPHLVVDELNRVAAKAVAISDANFMGQGSSLARLLKLALYSLGLWPVADFIKTRGTGYTISEGDGLAYSYTVFQNLPQLKRRWKRVNLISTAGRPDGAFGTRTTAPHLFVVGWDGELAMSSDNA